MNRLLIWREGAKARLSGANFGMNPYGPPPNFTNATPHPWKGLAWAKGYWWADKYRTTMQTFNPKVCK